METNSNSIEKAKFVGSLAYLLRETFEGSPEGQMSAYLDHGTGFFPTLETLTAAQASQGVIEMTIAAQTEHAKFYLDRLCEYLHGRTEAVRCRVEKIGWKRYAGAMASVVALGKQEHWKKVRGGNDLLPRAFAERLKDKIRFESPVVKVGRDAGGVTVYFDEKGKVQSLRGELLLVAIPFPMLSKVEFSPALSRPKADVIRTTTYESASRVLLETKTRFWHHGKVNGFAVGENLAEIWEGSFGQPGTHGLLQNYVRGEASLALTKQAPGDRLTGTVKGLEKFFPGLGTNYVQGFSKCWSEDPWTRGAWGLLAGDRLETGRAPEGRIFFAGEHLSGHASWMQGALQSGLSAVERIKSFRPVSRGGI